MAEQVADPAPRKAGFNTLLRFLPLLWPRGEAELKVRVVVALTLVLAGKAIALLMPFAYKAVVDGMSANRQAFGAVLMLVVAYAAARFGNVLADNLRNAVFEKVGQQAGRRLAATVFRHLGIDLNATWRDPQGRPIPIVAEGGQPIRELS